MFQSTSVRLTKETCLAKCGTFYQQLWVPSAHHVLTTWIKYVFVLLIFVLLLMVKKSQTTTMAYIKAHK